MKKLVEQVENEGLEALMGERVLLMCAGYFYEGKLIGVSETFVKLDDAAIVYSTGEWSDKDYSDIQKLHQKEWYVMKHLIESFGRSKNA
jgi:flagellar biosynthesis GTPase FlhF